MQADSSTRCAGLPRRDRCLLSRDNHSTAHVFRVAHAALPIGTRPVTNYDARKLDLVARRR